MGMKTADKLKVAMALKEAYEGAIAEYLRQASRFELAIVLGSLDEDKDTSPESFKQRIADSQVSTKLREVSALCKQLAKEQQDEIDLLLAGIDAVDQAKEAVSND